MYNTSFILDGYRGIREFQLIFIVILTLLYPITIIANMLIIYIICVTKCLHKPLYIFICNLSLINLYGGSGMTPFILINIFKKDKRISLIGCLVQSFTVHTYAGCEITNLMVMGYDRYLAICFPLKYEQIMSTSKVIICVAFTWLVPVIRCCITVSITTKLQLCRIIIDKVYCDNYSVVKLACSDISANNIYSATTTFLYAVMPFFIICYSYVRIIVVSLTISKGGQAKVMKTCIPHIVATLNFTLGCAFEKYQSQFDMTHLPYTLRVFLSLYFLILSPFVNPIVYGVRTEKIKRAINKKASDIIFKMHHLKG